MAKAKTQDQLAAIFATLYPNLLYDEQTQSYWEYDGKVYRMLEARELEKRIINSLPGIDPLVSLTEGYVGSFFYILSFKVASADGLHDDYLAFEDCIFDPATGRTFPHGDKSKVATVLIPTKFERAASLTVNEKDSPLLHRYFSLSCQRRDGTLNQKMVDQLGEIAGYFLTPMNRELCFILRGEGNDGKSVFLELLTAMMGGDHRTSSLTMNEMSRPFAASSCLGKRANIVHEDENDNADVPTLKKFISQQPMKIERKFQAPFNVRLPIKLIFASNKPPRFDTAQVAIDRRFFILPFQRTVKDEEIIFELSKKIIHSELPYFFAFALQGLRRLSAQNYRLTQSPETLKAKSEFLVDSSPVLEFITAENIVKTADHEMPTALLYAKFREWAEANQRGTKLSSNGFGREMTSQGFAYKKRNLNGQTANYWNAKYAP